MTTKTTRPVLSACCAVPVATRPAVPGSVVADSVTYCPSCATALTMGRATPGCLCCGLLASRGAELPCGDCR